VIVCLQHIMWNWLMFVNDGSSWIRSLFLCICVSSG
jgi:hypothetical protein